MLKTLVSREAYCVLLTKESCHQPLRLDYCISSKNSRPSINRLPQIIALNPHPSRYLLFLYHLPVELKNKQIKAEEESHPAKLISDDSSSNAKDIEIEK